MKKIQYAILAMLVASAFISCDKDETNSTGKDDYLIFGTFYGKCAGEECVETYKIEQNRLLEDQKDLYAVRDFYPFDDFTVLSQAKFDLVKDLIDFLPDTLKESESGVIGQPDAGDWGGAFVELKSGNLHRYWVLDQLESNMPEVFNDFVDKINEKVALINQ
jgi:hypothetical protein